MRPIRRSDDRFWVKFIYYYNELYNLVFRKIFGNLSNETIKSGTHISDNDDSILGKFFSSFMASKY